MVNSDGFSLRSNNGALIEQSLGNSGGYLYGGIIGEEKGYAVGTIFVLDLGDITDSLMGNSIGDTVFKIGSKDMGMRDDRYASTEGKSEGYEVGEKVVLLPGSKVGNDGETQPRVGIGGTVKNSE